MMENDEIKFQSGKRIKIDYNTKRFIAKKERRKITINTGEGKEHIRTKGKRSEEEKRESWRRSSGKGFEGGGREACVEA